MKILIVNSKVRKGMSSMGMSIKDWLKEKKKWEIYLDIFLQVILHG